MSYEKFLNMLLGGRPLTGVERGVLCAALADVSKTTADKAKLMAKLLNKTPGECEQMLKTYGY